jgi:hypothetical protein
MVSLFFACHCFICMLNQCIRNIWWLSYTQSSTLKFQLCGNENLVYCNLVII